MPRASIGLEGASVVFAGAFNPAIFHPIWFVHQGLLPEAEAEQARGVITTPQVSAFSTEQFRVQVTAERFVAATENTPAYEPLRDLAVGTFRVLGHTPLRQLGINRHVHFKTQSVEVWHEVGHRLAPKQIWQSVLRQPGMRSLVIQAQRPDDHRGTVLVRVEPSVRVEPGVFLDINDHYELDEEKPGEVGTQLVGTLEQEWPQAHLRATQIIERVGEFIWMLQQPRG